MTLDLATLSPPDERQAAILEAAFETFCRYGTRRTSMEDIARGAGMSRATLYLHFRNKDDIIRSLTTHYFAKTVQDLRRVLASTDDLHRALLDGLRAGGGEAMAAIMASAHGQELLDTKQSVTATEAQAGEAAQRAVWVDWIRERARAGNLSLDATTGDAVAMVESLFASWHGLKGAVSSLADYDRGLERLASIFARAMRT